MCQLEHSKLLQLEHNHCHKLLEHSKLLQLEHNHCRKRLGLSKSLRLEHSMKLQQEHSTLAQRCIRSRDCS